MLTIMQTPDYDGLLIVMGRRKKEGDELRRRTTDFM